MRSVLDPAPGRFTMQAFARGALSAFAHSPTFAVRDYTGEPAVDGTDLAGSGPLMEAHGMDPARVLHLASSLGGKIDRLLIVGCEPAVTGNLENFIDGLSDPVRPGTTWVMT